MRPFAKAVLLWLIVIIVILFFGVYIFLNKTKPLTEVPVEKKLDPVQTVIGTSVQGRKIEAYTYGKGEQQLLFVGGIHGGYEWNSVVLAYRFIDYLKANPTIIPSNLTVSIIPSANPDGVYKVTNKEGYLTALDIPADVPTAPGRFNAHEVDLNRNFACKWKPTGTWRGEIVSAGTEAFSEPEARAIRDYVLESKPIAVIFWHSQANTVYPAECEEGITLVNLEIMNIYAKASGYLTSSTFDSYEVTGDAEGWLASIGITAITVELKTHETIEWEQNFAGINALFRYYGVVE